MVNESAKIPGTYSPVSQSQYRVERPEEEEKLLEHAVAGNRKAFDKLVTRYHGQVYRLAFRFFNNPEDALDATQEVFLKAFRAIAAFQGRSSFKTWLFRITSNTCSTILQERTKQKKTFIESILEWFTTPPGEDPEEAVLKQEYQRELQGALQEKISKLPEVYRMPLILKDVESYSLEEISEILDLKEGTVKSRINRGRRLLQESLEGFLRRGEKDEMHQTS